MFQQTPKRNITTPFHFLSPRIFALQRVFLLTIPASLSCVSVFPSAISIATKITRRSRSSMSDIAASEPSSSRAASRARHAELSQRGRDFLVYVSVNPKSGLFSSSRSYKSRAMGRLFSLMKLMATPVFPARPVRPIRWT